MSRKDIRRKQILNVILELGYIPKSLELAERFKVSDRTIRTDLNEITPKIPEAATEDLHKIVVLQLRKRAPEMKDKDLIRLAEFFLSKKTEVKSEVEGEVTLKMSRGEEIEQILKELASASSNKNGEGTATSIQDGNRQPVDSAHSDAEANPVPTTQ